MPATRSSSETRESKIATPHSNEGKEETGMNKSPLMMGIIFILWYGTTAMYNIYNQKMKVFNYPLTVATSQLVIGMCYALPLWLLNLRAFPKVSLMEIITHIAPVALLNAVGHCSAVVAMFEKGGGSFTHVIKASEPVVSVLFGIVINSTIPATFTCLSLLPIVYGVAYASTLGQLSIETMSKELTTKAAMLAMVSNVAFALRSIMRKNMNPTFKSKINSDNDHALTTLYTLVLITPIALYYENYDDMKNTIISMDTDQYNTFLFDTFLCGMSWYLYNEFQNSVLASLGPVPTAVGNTLKRVFIFVGLYLFIPGEVFPLPKVIGCVIAIIGCLIYAICNSKKI